MFGVVVYLNLLIILRNSTDILSPSLDLNNNGDKEKMATTIFDCKNFLFCG